MTDGSRRAFPWVALRVRPRWEKIAAEILHNKGYEEFVPLYKCRHRWCDRYKELLVPLFPGYLFCRLDDGSHAPILTTPGVLHFVGIGRTPLPIEEGEIAAVRAIVDSGLAAGPWPFLQVGSRVRIDDGPLQGLEGILLEFKRQHRLVVSVTLLQRSVAVEIEGDWVTPIGPMRVPPGTEVADPSRGLRTA